MKYENINEEIVVVFNEMFEEMDRILFYGVEEKLRNCWSGCFVLMCLLWGNNLYVVNVGNIWVVLCCGDGLIECLLDNYSFWDKKEWYWIWKVKGDVFKSDKIVLVNGVVKSIWGFGNYGDLNLKISVIRIFFVNCFIFEDID